MVFDHLINEIKTNIAMLQYDNIPPIKINLSLNTLNYIKYEIALRHFTIDNTINTLFAIPIALNKNLEDHQVEFIIFENKYYNDNDLITHIINKKIIEIY